MRMKNPPARSQIRPKIWALRGKEFIVDESASGLVKGEFVWMVGDGECEVLERFMQECEFDWGWFKGRKVGKGEGKAEAEREDAEGGKVVECCGRQVGMKPRDTRPNKK